MATPYRIYSPIRGAKPIFIKICPLIIKRIFLSWRGGYEG
jgi:hypothetical protein